MSFELKGDIVTCVSKSSGETIFLDMRQARNEAILKAYADSPLWECYDGNKLIHTPVDSTESERRAEVTITLVLHCKEYEAISLCKDRRLARSVVAIELSDSAFKKLLEDTIKESKS